MGWPTGRPSFHPATVASRYRRTNRKAPTRIGAFVARVRETEFEPMTRRLRVDVNDSSPARRIRRFSDGCDEINDLLDLQASLIRLIASSQPCLRELSQQYIDQQLAVVLEKVLDAFARQPSATLGRDFGQQRMQTREDGLCHFASPSALSNHRYFLEGQLYPLNSKGHLPCPYRRR